MLRKDLSIYTIVMLLSFYMVYWVSKPVEEKRAEEDVLITEIDSSVWTQIRYESKKQIVTIDNDTSKPRSIVKVDAKENKEGLDASSEFVASSELDGIVKWFSRLYAKRKLGAAKDFKLTEFGFEDDVSDLVILSGDKELVRLKIGKKAYGSSSRFAVIGATDELLLLDGKPFSRLENASKKLFANKITPVVLNKYNAVSIKRMSDQSTLDYEIKDIKGQKKWIIKDDTSGKVNDSVGNLLRKVTGWRVSRYLSVDEERALLSEKSMYSLSLKGGDGDVALDFFKVETVKEGSTEKEAKYYVTSSDLGRMGELSSRSVEKVFPDFETLF